MKNRILIPLLLIAAFLLALPPAPAQSKPRISVRLLNMSDTPLGPVVVATHPATDRPVLDPASPPSAGLRMLAAGREFPLRQRLEALARRDRTVQVAVVPGPRPGRIAGVELPVRAYQGTVSLAAHLPERGIIGFASEPVSDLRVNRVDVLAWEADRTLVVHRTRNSPAARAWLRKVWPASEPQPEPEPVSPNTALTAAQQAERDACLDASESCVWRLEDGRGVCLDCVPPLRPNAARTHCAG